MAIQELSEVSPEAWLQWKHNQEKLNTRVQERLHHLEARIAELESLLENLLAVVRRRG